VPECAVRERPPDRLRQPDIATHAVVERPRIQNRAHRAAHVVVAELDGHLDHRRAAAPHPDPIVQVPRENADPLPGTVRMRDLQVIRERPRLQVEAVRVRTLTRAMSVPPRRPIPPTRTPSSSTSGWRTALAHAAGSSASRSNENERTAAFILSILAFPVRRSGGRRRERPPSPASRVQGPVPRASRCVLVTWPMRDRAADRPRGQPRRTPSRREDRRDRLSGSGSSAPSRRTADRTP
jgi:hypothetical protein